MVLFDNRKNSPSKGALEEIILSPTNHSLITIPNNIWNGFKGLDPSESIVANCLDNPHDEKEMVRKELVNKGDDIQITVDEAKLTDVWSLGTYKKDSTFL